MIFMQKQNKTIFYNLKQTKKMKKSIMLFVAIFMMAGFTTTLMAQTNTENTTAGAKIVSALTITETAALHFGTMAIPTGAVDLVLTTGTVRNPSVPANITLLPQAPVAANAGYNVAGSASATYAIQLPPDNTVTITEGSNPMHVDGFVAKTASAGVDGLTGTLNGSGTDTFVVGATLKLANAQPFGTYVGTFNVTVNYN